MRHTLLLLSVLSLTACVEHRDGSAASLHDHREIELDHSEMARVEVRMGVGDLRVSSGSPKLMEADFTYDEGEKPVVTHRASSFRTTLTLEEPKHTGSGSHSKHEWNVRLHDGLPTDVVAHLGVGEAHMTLGSMNLRSLEIHMGVGELDLDLRGTPTRGYEVQIHGGVGSATVRVPTGVAIIADARGGIGEISGHGLEKRDGHWINPKHEKSPITIHLDISGGVGEIQLIAE